MTAIAKQRPDLVMMDVKLPDQDGLDLLKSIKRDPDLDIIVMTFGGSSSAIKAMEHGAYDYVTKPFEVDDLLATLRRVFEHHDMAPRSALRLELGKSAADREEDRRLLQADDGGLQAHREGGTFRKPPCSSPGSPGPGRSWSRRRCIGPASAIPIRW